MPAVWFSALWFFRPSKPVAGVQEAALRTAERILGEETPSGVIKLPHKCTLRMLLFKYQIGAVMGKKGQAINEIRNKSGASVKLLSPQGGAPIVPAADADDELITVSQPGARNTCDAEAVPHHQMLQPTFKFILQPHSSKAVELLCR